MRSQPRSGKRRRSPAERLLRQQMQAIGELQRRLLPREIPQFPGWSIAACCAVSPWPSGDYYDLLPLPNGDLGLFIADASGHGGPSAVMVAQVRTMLHSCPLTSGQARLPFCPLASMATQPPDILLGHLNRILEENTLDDQFMTAFSGQLDPASGVVRYACAGHPSPRWWQAATATVGPLPDVSGPPLGIGLPATSAPGRVTLAPGDVLVCCTDGLLEAWNQADEMFGLARLDAALRTSAPQGADAVCRRILTDLDQFLNGQAAQDDVTLLVLQRAAAK
jgi:sigma-B regulation protein RsbU (phosphoserine phosphatase)